MVYPETSGHTRPQSPPLTMPMKLHLLLIAILLVIALALTFVIDAEADPGVAVPWEKDCDNLFKGDGFWDRGYCVPGQITKSTHYAQSPSRFHGVGSSYAPGIMERLCKERDCDGYKGGVATMSCGDIGRTAWLKFENNASWYGPLKVVDCSQPFHAYVNIVEIGLAVEWGYDVSEAIGRKASSVVRVHLGSRPPRDDNRWGWYYRTWWIDYALEWVKFDLHPPLFYIGIRNIAIVP